VTGLAFLTVIGVPACTVPGGYHSPLRFVNPPAAEPCLPERHETDHSAFLDSLNIPLEVS
jgi:hypothetical protein